MKRLVVFLALTVASVSWAAEYESTLLVQTGKLRESDLVVRIVSDLESNKNCLAFYVRTEGTSPVISCYDATSGYRSKINMVGHFKEGKLVVRKLKDYANDVSCLVAYVSTPGTSPNIDCYKSSKSAKDALTRSGKLSEGDLEVYRIVDPESTKNCLVAYVTTGGTSPSLVCYNSIPNAKGGMAQTNLFHEGDLIVRKIVDQANRKECLISYVSTEGTSPNIYCSDLQGAAAQAALPPGKPQFRPATHR
jgi:hypothetical protein